MVSEVPVRVVSSATTLGKDAVGCVVVSGSHAGVVATAVTARTGARAAIHHDAGFGRDHAGVRGLDWADRFGMAVAAVSYETARIGDGEDVLRRGVISLANRSATACGVCAGMSCSEAAGLLRGAPLPHSAPDPFPMLRATYDEAPGRRRILWLDSVTHSRAEDASAIVAVGSHGGMTSGEHALQAGLQLVIFNDAGIGIDDAGVAALKLLERSGLAALAVSAQSARIGEGLSTLRDGIVSRVNAPARKLGADVGVAALEFARSAARQAGRGET